MDHTNTVFTKSSLQGMNINTPSGKLYKEQEEKAKYEAAKKEYDQIIYKDFKLHVTDIINAAKQGRTEYRISVKEPFSFHLTGIKADFEDPQYIVDKYFEYAVSTFPDSEVYIDRVITMQKKEDRSYIQCRCYDVTLCKCYDPPIPVNSVCIVIDWS